MRAEYCQTNERGSKWIDKEGKGGKEKGIVKGQVNQRKLFHDQQ